MSPKPRASTQAHHAAHLLRAQVYIQNNLDGNLSLQAVAQAAGLSAAHFHRLFRAHVGETVKTYVDRLRVEKSVYDIQLSDLNLMQIALRYGFKNPETYTRVFKRHMGKRPSAFLKLRTRGRLKPVRHPEEPAAWTIGLRRAASSNFSITRLAACHLAFARHVGPYQAVPLVQAPGPNIWTRLAAFVQQRQLAGKAPVHMGIPQDNPATTAPDKLRYDVCLMVDRPFQPEGPIGYQQIPAGYYGVLTHAGPYATLGQAYQTLFARAQTVPGFSVQPGVVFELLLDISAATLKDHTWTELYLPLQPKAPYL